MGARPPRARADSPHSPVLLARLTGLVLAAFFLMAAGPARANDVELTSAQDAIFATAASPGGYLTAEMHERFWRDVPRDVKTDPKVLTPFADGLNKTVRAGMRFQLALWQSARLSAETGAVTYAADYEAARAAAKRASQGPDDGASLLTDQANRLLTAAANREPLILPDGITALTPAQIERIETGVAAALARLALLLTPDWTPQAISYRDPDAGLIIETPQPFIRDRSTRPGQGGRVLTTVTLTRRDGERDFVFITYTEFSGPWRDPDAGLKSLAAAALRQAGTTAPDLSGDGISRTTWRDHPAWTGVGTGERDGETIHAAVTVSDLEGRHAALSFIAVTTRGVTAAEALRDRIASKARMAGDE